MKTAHHSLILSLAICLVYVWLKLPFLSPYSLQLFAVVVLLYFVIKKIHKASIRQLLPAQASIEMAIITIAFLLLIGATGNIQSVLFALSFVHLFLLALKTDLVTACIVTLEIVLFHFALTPQASLAELSFLVSLPVVMIFFLFAKQQYFKAFTQQQKLASQQAQLVQTQLIDQKLERFMQGLLEEKLTKLHRLSFFPIQNQRQMQAEMEEIAAITDELITQTQAEKQQLADAVDADVDTVTIDSTFELFSSSDLDSLTDSSQTTPSDVGQHGENTIASINQADQTTLQQSHQPNQSQPPTTNHDATAS
jgi:hypothetical protein